MIVHDVKQGSAEWHKLRQGKPTASDFERIITPSGTASAGAFDYACRLAAETLLNMTSDSLDGIAYVERGREMEPDAYRSYATETARDLRRVGFVTTDCGRFGCSPDALIIGSPGGAEFKCPSAPVHIGYLCNGFDKNYRVQVQGSLFVTALEWWDRYSFHPSLPGHRETAKRDVAFIGLIEERLNRFHDTLQMVLRRVKSEGFIAPSRVLDTALEREMRQQYERQNGDG